MGLCVKQDLDQRADRPLRFLRAIAILEGTTLVALMLVAVPLKRLAGIDDAVTIMGPVHGVAFLVYLYATVEAWAAGWLPAYRLALCVLVAFIPFGTWVHDRYLRVPAIRDPS